VGGLFLGGMGEVSFPVISTEVPYSMIHEVECGSIFVGDGGVSGAVTISIAELRG